MSLLTRCPRCRTLFRVTPAQLQARAGTVRCGRCMNVFDAYEALAADPHHALPAPSQPAAAPAEARAPAESPQSFVTAPGIENASAVTAGVAFPTASAAPTETRSTAADAPSVTTGDDDDAEADRPRASALLRKPTAAQLWSVGSAALLVLFVIQAVFAYRSELAARYPSVRSAYTAICERAGCTVTLPRRTDLVRIEASDVHMIDANRPQLVQLTATLRSYASYDLAYPALDLVLTNANEHALARRIFTPDEYLDQTRDPQSGIAGNAEITVALDLDTGNLNASGFRLDLLPAP